VEALHFYLQQIMNHHRMNLGLGLGLAWLKLFVELPFWASTTLYFIFVLIYLSI
jgi:hypothetical protein